MPESRWSLRADASGAQAGLRKAGKAFLGLGKSQKKTQKSSTSLKKTWTELNSKLEVMKKALNAAKAVWGVFDKLILRTSKDVATLGDSVAKTGRAFRVDTKWLQGYRSALGLAGVEVGVADKALLNIQKTALDAGRGLSTAVDLLAMAGVEAKDSNGQMKDTATLIGEISENLKSGMIPANEQAALSAQLFRDRSGMLVLGLKEGNAAIVESTERLERYGALMGGELLKVSEEYVDSQQRLKEAFLGVKNAIAEGALPTLTAFNNAFADFIGSQDDARTGLAKTLGEVMPQLILGAIRGGEAFGQLALFIHEVGVRIELMGALLKGNLVRNLRDFLAVVENVASRLGLDELAESTRGMVVDLTLSTKDSAAAINGYWAEIEETQKDSAALTTAAISLWGGYLDQVNALSKAAVTATGDLNDLAGAAPPTGDGDGDADFVGGGVTYDFSGDKDKVVELQDVVRQATQEMSLDFGRLGSTIGEAFSELVTAEDKAASAKSVFKKFMIEGIQLIGQYAAQAVSSRTSIMGTNITAAAAETAAQTPAAITGAIASEGANVGLATAALGAGIAAMTGLISAIGDAGIPPGLLGDGQHTVISMGGKERLLGPGATSDVDAMMTMLRGNMAQSLDGRGLTGGGVGGAGTIVTVQSDVYLDTDVIARKVSTHQARDNSIGIGPFSDFAMGTS